MILKFFMPILPEASTTKIKSTAVVQSKNKNKKTERTSYLRS